MHILILSNGDWTGSACALAKAVEKYTEYEAKAISFSQPGDYIKYDYDIRNPAMEELRQRIEWADVINVHDDAERLVPIDCLLKPTIETYHGSWFRRDPEKVCMFATNRKRKQTTLTEDLSQYGPIFLGHPMMDLSTQKINRNNNNFVVCHAPTNRATKGTNYILERLCDLPEIKLDIIEHETNAECLKRKAAADLLIDTISPPGTPHGICVNALEAWSLGMPVISVLPTDLEDHIRKIVGYIPYCSLGEDQTLRDLVLKFRNDGNFYDHWVEIGRKYLKEWHDPKNIAERFIKICEESLAEWTPPKRTKAISVCLIMKDENGFVQKAINSTRGLADEVIIGDTGSVDGSIEVARNLGCKVLMGNDQMHKGQSRNRTLSEATGDWVIVLDADEEIADPLELRKYLEETDAEAVYIKAGFTMLKGGKPAQDFHQLRCWRNGKMRYKYRAHELPEPVGKAGNQVYSNFLFAHYPKPHGPERMQYTLDRLLLDRKDWPDAGRVRYYLGRQYRYMGKWEEAIEELKIFLDLTKETGHWDRPNAAKDLSLCYQALKNTGEEVRWLYQAIAELPYNRTWYCDLALIYRKQGLHEIASGLLKAALEIPPSKEQGYINKAWQGFLIYDILALALWSLNRFKEGKIYATEALRLAPKNDAQTYKRLEDNVKHFEEKLRQKKCEK